jgi:hypothetical protein
MRDECVFALADDERIKLPLMTVFPCWAGAGRGTAVLSRTREIFFAECDFSHIWQEAGRLLFGRGIKTLVTLLGRDRSIDTI